MDNAYSLVRSNRLDSIFALPYFVDLEARDDEKTWFYVRIEDANVNTVTPVIISKLKLGLKVAFCPTPPQVIGSTNRVNSWEQVLRTLIHYLKDNHNCVVVFINQRPHDPQFVRGRLDICKLSHNYDILIDLTSELRTIYHRMDKRHRYILRKSSGCSYDELSSGDWLQKTCLVIRQESSENNLHEFRTLWLKTLKRMHQSFNPLTKLLYRDPLDFNRLVTVFNELHPRGLVKLFTIYNEDGQPGASAIFYSSNNLTKIPMTYWSAGASSEEARSKGLPLLLQWYIIQWFKEHGYQRYYMGGYDIKNPHDGPSLFKRGFGGQIVSGLTATWITQPLNTLYNLSSYVSRLTSTIRKIF